LLAPRTHIVERESSELRAHAVAFELRHHFRVRESARLALRGVFREAGKLAIELGLVPARGCVVVQ